MKTYARYAYILTLALAPVGCGDDAQSNEETSTPASTTDTSSTDPSSGESTADEASTSGSSSGVATDAEDSSSGTADESSTGGEDPFANCSRDVLENDYYVVSPMGEPGPARWYGPGADEGGNLLDDGESEYVVSVTYLPINPESYDLFLGLAAGNAMALFSNPGMVALQLGGEQACLTGRTFTVWEDMEAMMSFVGSPAHVESISAFPQISRGGSYLSVWPEPVPAPEITLENAMARLTDEVAYD
jgi:hypothetical protein